MHYKLPVTVLTVAVLLCGCVGSGNAQVPEGRSNMDARLQQAIGILLESPGCGAADAAIRLGMETLYGGLRPVPSKGALRETEQADQKISGFEQEFAAALQQFIQKGQCPDLNGVALDFKLFIEQLNEVAVAVGRVTRQCGEGDNLQEPPCDALIPLLDEKTGHRPEMGRLPKKLKPSFSVKLRSPFVPWRTTFGWEEDLFQTDPIKTGECVAVVKETRGLMLKLHLDRIVVVKDPWATPMLARGIRVPIWTLEFIPSQYVKTWSICNTCCSGLETTVTQRVKQDRPLNFFWRYYPKSHGGKY